MPRACAQILDKLSKSFVQVLDLCAVSTGRFLNSIFDNFLYQLQATADTQPRGSYTQPNTGFLIRYRPVCTRCPQDLLLILN
jgi:hypothetical protein